MKQIPLSQGLVALVDDVDYARLSRFQWYANKIERTCYARMTGSKEFMHRVILGLSCGDGIKTDHADRNGLNNQRHNLRVCTNAENMRNRTSARSATSRYLGVCSFPGGKWRAQSRLPREEGGRGRKVHLGLFDTEEDAARAYDRFARERFGAFANPNFPTEADAYGTL